MEPLPSLSLNNVSLEPASWMSLRQVQRAYQPRRFPIPIRTGSR